MRLIERRSASESKHPIVQSIALGTANLMVGWPRLDVSHLGCGGIVDVPPFSALISLRVVGDLRSFLPACCSHVAFFRTAVVVLFEAALIVADFPVAD